MNSWLLDYFRTSLFVASGYAPCSADSLKNMPKGSYKAVFREVGRQISRKKAHRYSAEEIIRLNSLSLKEGRECRICKTIDVLDDDSLCEICSAMKNLSRNVLYQNFFVVLSNREEGAVPLMKDRWLKAESEADVKKRIDRKDGSLLSVFSKNAFYSGETLASKLWTGDYTVRNATMGDFSEYAEGIDRIAVLRMDVDNLGSAFVSGFENQETEDRYVTISRTASFSRQLTIFFKYHINHILSEPVFCKLGIQGGNSEGRKVTIVYSGGDDVFIIGAWNDVIEASVDIREHFKIYSQERLTISGGIGIYKPKYPVHIMAEETEELQSCSKKGNKNAITVFEPLSEDESGIRGGRYAWEIFEKKVFDEKYSAFRKFLEKSEERGKRFLYRLLELIRGQSEQINFVRLIYLLSRLEPSQNATEEQKKNYREFTRKILNWIKSEEDRREMITAIYLYVYYVRKAEEEE